MTLTGAFTALTILTCFPLCVMTQEAELPEVLYTSRGSYALWISAPALSMADGLFHLKKNESTMTDALNDQDRALWVKFQERMLTEVSRHKEQGSPDCLIRGGLPTMFEFPATTYRQVLETGHSIAVVRIVSMTPGFYQLSTPALTLTVEVEKWLRTTRTIKRSLTSFHLFFPNSQFKIGDLTFCGEHRDFSFEPEIGQRLLVFPRNPSDESGSYFIVDPSHILAETQQGGFQRIYTLGGAPLLNGIDSFNQLVGKTEELCRVYGPENRQGSERK